MMMLGYEIKKVLWAPMIIFLILVFLGFNIYFIMSHRNNASEINDINDIAGITGIEINDEFYEKLTNIYMERYEGFINLYREKIGGEIVDTDDIDQMIRKMYTAENLSESEEKILDRFVLINYLKQEIENIDDIYSHMDAVEMVEAQIKMYRIGGTAEDLAYKKGALIQKRIDEIVEDNEGHYLFFSGKVYYRHSFVFKELFNFITVETMLMAILITLSSINNEYVKKTDGLVYSTKVGRNLLKYKFVSSIIASILVFLILTGITFIVYFTIFNYSNVLDVPVTSILNAEPITGGLKPVLTWHRMTYVEYFVGCLMVVLFLNIIYVMIAYITSNFSKNSFLSFCAIMLIFGIGINLPALLPLDKAFTLFTSLNPFILTLYCGAWFTDGGIIIPIPYFETVIIIIWIVLMGTFSLYRAKSFAKKDLL